ncbi:hypothetical protein ACLOJK_015655 [Asimina triloba]
MSFQPIPGSGSGSGSSSNSGFQFLNSPFGDTTYTKVFVGGLAWETQSDTMRRYFEQFGEILEAVVIYDKNTGRSKGYGFVGRHTEVFSGTCATEVEKDWTHRKKTRDSGDGVSEVGGRNAAGSHSFTVAVACVKGQEKIRGKRGDVGGAVAIKGMRSGADEASKPILWSSSRSPRCLHGKSKYTAYGPEYVYPQNVYSPYMGQQYLQIYGIPGTVNTAVYPFGQLELPWMALNIGDKEQHLFQDNHSSYCLLTLHSSHRVVVQTKRQAERNIEMINILRSSIVMVTRDTTKVMSMSVNLRALLGARD